MRQGAFLRYAGERWNRTEAVITQLSNSSGEPADQFPSLYSNLCHDLAIARDKHFAPAVVERLNDLVLEGHRQLYRRNENALVWLAHLFGVAFPATVRREWRAVIVSLLLFLGVQTAVTLWVVGRPAVVHSILPPDVVTSFERMYDPASERFLEPIDSESRVAMFGYYIYNNIGIALRMVGSGLLLGLGSVASLVYNGVFLGAVSGHIVNVGHHDPFLRFVVGHAALELIAIVFAGVAGLRIGWSIIAPGRLRRSDALRLTTHRMLPLVYGATAMLLLAAAVEAFWSPHVFPLAVEIAVGAAWFGAIVCYCVFAGRRFAL